MKIEVLIHGPRHMLYGPSEHEKYAASFYVNEVQESVRFLVENINKEKPTIYYTYARYGKFLDINDRAGQYIGLTLCVTDGFIPDFEAVYLILDRAFKMDAVGLIVDEITDGYKYRVDSFANIKDNISNRIEKRIEDMLAGLLRGAIYPALKTRTDNKLCTLAIADTKELRLCQELLQKYGKILFTSGVRSMADNNLIKRAEEEKDALKKQHNTEITSLRQNAEKEIKGKNEDISHLTNEANKLKHEKSELNKDLEKSRSELKRATDEINAFKDEKQKIAQTKKKIDEIQKENNRLKEELKKMQDLGDKGGYNDNTPNKMELLKSIATFVNSFLCIAICIILCLFVWGKVGVQSNTEPSEIQPVTQHEPENTSPVATTNIDTDSTAISSLNSVPA